MPWDDDGEQQPVNDGMEDLLADVFINEDRALMCKWTNQSLDMLLPLLYEAFKDVKFPKSHYEVKNNCSHSDWGTSPFTHASGIAQGVPSAWHKSLGQ